MSLKLLDHLFSGPFDPGETVVRRNKPACVFAVISREGKSYNPIFRVIDLGDTANETVDFSVHPALDDWRRESTGELGLYFYRPDLSEPAASAERGKVIDALRAAYTPPTGLVAIDGSV